MAKPVTVSRFGNQMRVVMDDGREYLASPTGYGYWTATAAPAAPPPEPTPGFKWVFARGASSTYPGHSGIDWPGGRVGNSAKIVAIGDGVVSGVWDTDYNTTYMGKAGANEPIWRGICVRVDHGVIAGERIYSLYAHLSSRSVSDGQAVAGGQQLGVIGNTGYSFGTHLHFEIDVNGQRRPTDSVPSGYDVSIGWMDANANGTW